jgi:cob(I)alamin adenosyltransferase
MSIATKTGDDGTTGLMYGRRVPKNHPRVEACGSVDELNAAIGQARALATGDFIRHPLLAIQQDLVVLMGETGVANEDLNRYTTAGYSQVTPEMTARLDVLVQEIESLNLSFQGWATPGATIHAAALDVARTVCRRAERRVFDLSQTGDLKNREVGVYLNRLSDLLWLMARWSESQDGGAVQ